MESFFLQATTSEAKLGGSSHSTPFDVRLDKLCKTGHTLYDTSKCLEKAKLVMFQKLLLLFCASSYDKRHFSSRKQYLIRMGNEAIKKTLENKR